MNLHHPFRSQDSPTQGTSHVSWSAPDHTHPSLQVKYRILSFRPTTPAPPSLLPTHATVPRHDPPGAGTRAGCPRAHATECEGPEHMPLRTSESFPCSATSCTPLMYLRSPTRTRHHLHYRTTRRLSRSSIHLERTHHTCFAAPSTTALSKSAVSCSFSRGLWDSLPSLLPLLRDMYPRGMTHWAA